MTINRRYIPNCETSSFSFDNEEKDEKMNSSDIQEVKSADDNVKVERSLFIFVKYFRLNYLTVKNSDIQYIFMQ